MAGRSYIPLRSFAQCHFKFVQCCIIEVLHATKLHGLSAAGTSKFLHGREEFFFLLKRDVRDMLPKLYFETNHASGWHRVNVHLVYGNSILSRGILTYICNFRTESRC